MIFTTERLYVRELKESDLGCFHELQSDNDVMQYVTGHAFSLKENRQQLNKTIQRYGDKGNIFLIWGVVRKFDNKLIGTCAIVGDKNAAEVGYRLVKNSWRNGFGKEVCNGLVNYAKTNNYQQLIAYVESGNEASIKVLEQSALSFIKTSKSEEGIDELLYQWSVN